MAQWELWKNVRISLNNANVCVQITNYPCSISKWAEWPDMHRRILPDSGYASTVHKVCLLANFSALINRNLSRFLRVELVRLWEWPQAFYGDDCCMNGHNGMLWCTKGMHSTLLYIYIEGNCICYAFLAFGLEIKQCRLHRWLAKSCKMQ